jgi:hypothetical protein
MLVPDLHMIGCNRSASEIRDSSVIAKAAIAVLCKRFALRVLDH